jgi:transposase
VAISTKLILNASRQDELVAISQSRSLPAGYVFRAKLIVMLAEGASFRTIKHKLGTTAPTIIRWKERFLSGGTDGLDTYHPASQPPSVLTPALRARILGAIRKKPADGSTHWSCRKLALHLGVSKDVVHRVWKEAGLKPHRIERYLASDDPDFESKAVYIVGLYLNPPQVEIWFSKVERDVIARGIFSSVKSGPQASLLYQRHSTNAKSIQWRYSDPTASAVTLSLRHATS